jgi:hypothetical protein
LTLEQCLLSFIFYIKHDNVIKYDVPLYNWSKSAIDDDDIFIFLVSYINFVIVKAKSSQISDMFPKEFPKALCVFRVTLCDSAIEYSSMEKLKKNALQQQ